MVGGWWDGSEIRSIVNGIFERPLTYTGDLGSTLTPLYIGKDFDDWVFFNGIIDEVRVYNRSLSETEIKHLYNI